jgi:hypothetical protein
MSTAQQGATGRGGIHSKWVSGVLTFINALTKATIYTINPSTKAVNFVGAVSVDGVFNGSGGIAFPDSDPQVAGYWWDNAGTLTKSSG